MFAKDRYTNYLESFSLVVFFFSRIKTSKFVQICYHEGTEYFVHVPIKLRNVCMKITQEVKFETRDVVLKPFRVE